MTNFRCGNCGLFPSRRFLGDCDTCAEIRVIDERSARDGYTKTDVERRNKLSHILHVRDCEESERIGVGIV